MAGPLLLLLALSVFAAAQAQPGFLDEQDAHLLERGQKPFRVAEADYKDLTIFCYKGYERSLLSLWSSSHLRLKLDKLSLDPDARDDFDLFLGANASVVHAKYVESRSLLSTMLYSPAAAAASRVWLSKEIPLHPFQNSCVGIVTQQGYTATLVLLNVNFWLLLLCIFGMGLVLSAKNLCSNSFFHYTTGITVGVALSLLFLAYFVQKRLRAGSWFIVFHSLAAYLLTNMWYNMQTYLQQYHVYALGYLAVAAAISFAILYRMGPVENPRSLNLIRWAMQAFGLCLVFFSSYYQIASFSLCVILMLWINITPSQKAKIRSLYTTHIKRPDIKLLTETEYMDQARIHTKKELDRLREFCSSPKCDSWKVVSRLRSPNRFAEFVQGDSHLTETEVLNYSRSEEDLPSGLIDPQNLTDDDSSDHFNQLGEDAFIEH